MCTTSRRQAGFTLVELIFFIVVVAFGIAGILVVMNTTVKSSADPLVRKQTVAIAESLLEEILLKSYDDPDDSPAVVEASRALYDDVRDYAGYATSGGMKDLAGASISGLGSYNVSSVTVTAMTLSGIPARQVIVTVLGPSGPISLTGYRTNN